MREAELTVALVDVSVPSHQSLPLGYLRAYAEANAEIQDRVAFRTLEMSTESKPWLIVYRVQRTVPNIVCFSVNCWNADVVREACELLKRTDPSLIIVLGGPGVSPIAERVLAEQPSVDMVVRGEGEQTFAELLLTLLEDGQPWLCRGVTARNGDEIVSAPDRPLIENLDEIPSPYLTGVLTPLVRHSCIESYRGCSPGGAYCFEGTETSEFRCFSYERIAAEVAYLASSPQVEAISFVDSVFNFSQERLTAFADILEPHAVDGLRLHAIEVDIERIGEDEAAELCRAGVQSVKAGPHTVGVSALDAAGRTFDPDRFLLGVQALRAVGISVECDLIIGLPGDDPFDVIRGLRWLMSLDPGIVQSSTLRVLPGTRLWEQSESVGLVYHMEREHAVIRTPAMDFIDIRRLEIMAKAYQQAYRARVDATLHA